MRPLPPMAHSLRRAVSAFLVSSRSKLSSFGTRRFSLDLAKRSRRNSEEFSLWFQKQLILLRGLMVKTRTLRLPSTMTTGIGLTIGPVKYTWSEAAGHGAFIALALSYSEKDLFNLRMYACSGIFLNLIFQYYRSVPLWIPLRWNVLFLAINSAMIVRSLRAELVADYLPKEEKALYDSIFRAAGMTKVEFLSLINKATAIHLQAGDKLFSKDGERTALFIVQKGSLSVVREGTLVASVGVNQFVGEMGYFLWKRGLSEPSSSSSPSSPPSSSSSSESSTASSDLPLVGKSDVVALTPCTLYSWSFVDLDALLQAEPNIALTFERRLSSDLNKKMLQSNTSTSKYRYVLKGALIDGLVTDAKKKALHTYRVLHSISDEEHCDTLRELGWSQQRFDGIAAAKDDRGRPVQQQQQQQQEQQEQEQQERGTTAQPS